jgi:hypothetical protein
MIFRKMRPIIPFLLLAAVSAQGGTVYFSFNQHATQNLFQTSEAVSDQISVFSLGLNHDISALSLLANVDYSAFHQTRGLSFLAADLGLDYLVPAGAKSAFYFAAGAAGAFYSQDYAAFTSIGANLIAAFKTYLSPSSILKLQGLGTYATYRDALFDHLTAAVSFSIDKYFQSRTTLKAEAEYGFKYFLHPFVPEPAEPLPALGTELLGGGSGPGGGTGSGSGSGTGGGSGWRGPHYESDAGFIPRTSVEGGGAGIGHVAASFLLAQGLGDSVGLSASALRQWIVSGTNPFLSIEEFYFVSNPSSDSFSWEGDQITGRITLSLPWGFEVKTGYTYSDKSYPGVEVIGLDGLPTGVVRNDVRHLFEARLEKAFRQVSLFLAYSHIKNSSNDTMFGWSSGYIMAGIQWNLPTTRRGGRP